MRILVTTDGSLRSLSVLPHATAFANATDSELVLLRALDPEHEIKRTRGVAAHKNAEAVVEHWTGELRKVIETFASTAESAVTVLQRGERTSDAILREADERNAGMIALASRGAGAIRHALLGSVAMGVVGCSRLPVMIAGSEAGQRRRTKTYKILATTDGSDTSLRAIEAISPFLASPNISATLLRVYVPTFGDRGDRLEIRACRDEVERVKKKFPDSSPVRGIVSRLPAMRSIESAILKVAERLRSDAIVMSTHGYSAQHHLLAGSTALGVLGKSPAPVIVARAQPADGCR